jgi:hypothetical protein
MIMKKFPVSEMMYKNWRDKIDAFWIIVICTYSTKYKTGEKNSISFWWQK